MSSTMEETLERAYRHVADGWLPPQAEVLKRVQERLKQGAYDSDRTALTRDLKEDFALYVYCLKELSELISADEERHKRTPSEIFLNAPIEHFREILEAREDEISKHSISEMNEFQALRFKESMLSASTAEVLSESVKVDPDTGFSCALLRQLGLALIAWNYPRVYSRAVEKLDASVSLDIALRKVLGFTPSLLGLRFVERWNLSDEIREAFIEPKINRAGLLSVGATLAKICEVGEALARANDPDHYPTALDDWEHAQEEIAKHLGPDGLRLIYQRANDHLKQYCVKAPELMNFSESDAIREKIEGTQFASKLFDKNLYLRTVGEESRNEIRKLYTKFKPDKILKANVEQLVREIVPHLGFCRGAIFMYDPERRVLAPAVKIGSLPKEKLQTVKVFSVLAQYDLIASAFSLKTPIREETTDDQGLPTVAIAAALGQLTPIGVLYLETSSEFSSKHGADPMPHYRALRQTLCDCLNVS